MSTIPLYKEYHIDDWDSLKSINRREILRYAGVQTGDKNPPEDMKELMEECIKEALPSLTYRVNYIKDVINWDTSDMFPVLPINCNKSHDLSKNLSGCSEVIIFAATIGIGIDRLITRYSRVSPSRAIFMQAFGAERIEALCDTFEKDMQGMMMEDLRSEGFYFHPRFSPGYGDLALETQKEIFRVLDCERRMNLTLGDSLLMSPSKSVTAIIGVEHGKDHACQNSHISRGCENCLKTDCEYRKSI